MINRINASYIIYAMLGIAAASLCLMMLGFGTGLLPFLALQWLTLPAVVFAAILVLLRFLVDRTNFNFYLAALLTGSVLLEGITTVMSTIFFQSGSPHALFGTLVASTSVVRFTLTGSALLALLTFVNAARLRFLLTSFRTMWLWLLGAATVVVALLWMVQPGLEQDYLKAGFAVVEYLSFAFIVAALFISWDKKINQFRDFRSYFFAFVLLSLAAQAITVLSFDSTMSLSFKIVHLIRCVGYLTLFGGLLLQNFRQLKDAELRAQNLSLINEEVQQEIEERKWTEELLRETRLFAETIVESIRDPLLVLDGDLRIVRVNRAFYRMFKLKPASTVNRLLHEIGRGQWDRPELLEKVRRIIPKRESFENFEMTSVFPRSGAKTILINGHLINQKDLQTKLILVTMSDITATKLAQEEARRLASGVESAADSIMMTDPEGVVRYVNPAMTDLSGFSDTDLLGQKADMFWSEAKAADGSNGVWQKVQAGEVWRGEVTNRRKSGELYEALLTIAPIFDSEKALEGFVSVQKDVTELKAAREELSRRAEELAKSNAELEQFAYIASHDLQEPLRMVSSYCQLLRRRYRDKLDTDANEFIDFAVDGAMRMQKLIEDLLQYSRVGTHGQPFKRTDCGLVVNKALENLKLSIEDCDATVTQEKMPVMIADEIQLVQLFQNLIHNALKFRNGSAPVIKIACREHKKEWIFSVRDNGTGLDARYADRIFVIFQRLHNSDDIPGTGIGLAICKKIVERHEGRIWVESRPNAGATFSFSLPRLKEVVP